MSRFINTELKSDSDSDSDLDSGKVGSKFGNKEMAKLEKSGSDSEEDIYSCVFVYSYIFEGVIFSQALFQTYFLVGLKIHKQFNQFDYLQFYNYISNKILQLSIIVQS